MKCNCAQHRWENVEQDIIMRRWTKARQCTKFLSLVNDDDDMCPSYLARQLGPTTTTKKKTKKTAKKNKEKKSLKRKTVLRIMWVQCSYSQVHTPHKLYIHSNFIFFLLLLFFYAFKMHAIVIISINIVRCITKQLISHYPCVHLTCHLSLLLLQVHGFLSWYIFINMHTRIISFISVHHESCIHSGNKCTFLFNSFILWILSQSIKQFNLLMRCVFIITIQTDKLSLPSKLSFLVKSWITTRWIFDLL